MRASIALGIVLTATFLCAPARAQDKRAQARAAFEEGQRLYDVTQYGEAAKQWIKAYELVGDPVILFNIAQAYRLGNEPEKAIQFYRSFLRRGSPDPQQRAMVEQRLAELTKVVEQSKHAAEAPPQDALKPKPQSGEASVTPQPTPESQKSSEQPSATPTPTPEAQNPNPQPTPEPGPPVDHSKAFRYAGFGMAGLTVVALGVAGAMSGLAAAYSSDVSSAASNGGTFDSTLQSKDSNGPTFQNVGLAMWVVGGLAAVATGTLLYLGYRHPQEKAVSFAPVITPNAGGLVLEGRY